MLSKGVVLSAMVNMPVDLRWTVKPSCSFPIQYAKHQILDTGLPLLYIIYLEVGSFSRHGGISVNILLIFTLNYPTYTRPSGAFTLSMSGKCHPESSRDNNTVDSVLEMYLLDVATCYIATVGVASSPG